MTRYFVEDPDGNVVRERPSLKLARLTIEGAPYGWKVTDEEGVVLAFRGERAEALRVRARNDAFAQAKRGRPASDAPPRGRRNRRRRFWMTHHHPLPHE